jgi:DNA-binding FadR family transcriptional regulator
MLRERILATKPGEHLGSEQDLLAEYGVSPPTLRAASRILQLEGLMTAKRGVGGGYFSRTPESDVVTRVAAIYLRGRKTNMVDLAHAAAAVNPVISAMAAGNPSAEDRASLVRFVREYQARDRSDEADWILEVGLEFTRRIGQLSLNPPLALFTDVVSQLALAPGRRRRPTFSRDHVDETRSLHLAVAVAIAAGDQDLARALAEDLAAVGTAWVLAGRDRGHTISST